MSCSRLWRFDDRAGAYAYTDGDNSGRIRVLHGTLAIQGTSFFTFAVNTAGTVNVTLNSLTTGTTTPVTAIAVGLGLGVPSADGTSCVVSVSTITPAGLTTQLTTQAAKGTNCVQISDVGNLVVPLTFVVRVAHS